MACYEDLRALYAATAKERDELKRENAELREICQKQAEMNGRVAAMALELDEAKADRDALKKQRDGVFQAFKMLTEKYEQVGAELDEANAEIQRLHQENFWLTNGGNNG